MNWTSRIEQYIREGRTVSGGKGDQTAKNAEMSTGNFMTTLQNAFKTQFANQQGLLSFLSGKLTDAIKNPQGYSPEALAAARTSATEGVAKDFSNATIAAQDQIAAHGGNGLPSGVDAQIRGQIAGQGAAAESGQQNQITLENENQRQNNYWKAVSGAEGVAQMEDPLGYASGSNQAGNTISGLSDAYTKSKAQATSFSSSLMSSIGSSLGKAAIYGTDNPNG